LTCIGCAVSSSTNPTEDGTLCAICRKIVLQAHQVQIPESLSIDLMTLPDEEESEADNTSAMQRLQQNLLVRRLFDVHLHICTETPFHLKLPPSLPIVRY
jgi:hypothetical protein